MRAVYYHAAVMARENNGFETEKYIRKLFVYWFYIYHHWVPKGQFNISHHYKKYVPRSLVCKEYAFNYRFYPLFMIEPLIKYRKTKEV